MRRAVQRMARHHAVQADAGTLVALVDVVPRANVALAAALLDGIAQGWPEERPPQLTPEQRSALASAARQSSTELTAAFGRLAARWNLPEIFRTP
jgi:hypothetical protein